MADVLVRDGFAAYEDNPVHRRARLLRLTPAGRDALHTSRRPSVAGPTP
jgi:DNA-binding MarR family transcriptional regulator